MTAGVTDRADSRPSASSQAKRNPIGLKPAHPGVVFGLGIASGLLLWGSFFLPALAWIALVPLGLLAKLPGRGSLRYLSAWLGGFLHFLLGTYWLSYCADWVWIGWILLSAYLGVYAAAFVYCLRVVNGRWKVPMLFAMPLCWVALEYVRGNLMTGFGWLMLAHSAYQWPRVIQIADIAGVYGVSFILAMGSAIIVELMTLPLFETRSGQYGFNKGLEWRIAVAGLVIFLNVGYGQYRIKEANLRPGPTFAVIQTNVAQDARNDSLQSDEVFADVWKIARETETMPADLVIWPETSYPYPYGQCASGMKPIEIAQKYLERSTATGFALREPPTEEMGNAILGNFKDGDDHTQAMSRILGKPMLMGVVFWDITPAGATQTNSSILVLPDGGRDQMYHKVHLVPFGEFIPLGGWLPLVSYLLPYEADQNFDSDAGSDVRSIHVGKVHVAPLICFEDTFPYLARRYMEQATIDEPVDVLVNQTNDAWYKNSLEGDYHLAAGIFRCVETRRPMVRVSNAGPTVLVDSNGQVTQTFEKDGKRLGVSGVMSLSVPLDDRRTWYVSWGDWLPIAGLALIVAAVAGIWVVGLLHRRRARTT